MWFLLLYRFCCCVFFLRVCFCLLLCGVCCCVVLAAVRFLLLCAFRCFSFYFLGLLCGFCCFVVFVAVLFLLLYRFCPPLPPHKSNRKATDRHLVHRMPVCCFSVAFLPLPGGGLDVFVSDPPLPDQLIFGQPLSHLLRLSFSYTLPCISSAIVSSAADVAPSTSFACTAPVRKLWKQKKNLSLYIYMCIYVYMYLYMLS